MRVLIAAGGTAGHINPALAIAGAIKKADPAAEIHFAGRKEGMEYRLVTQAGYPFHHIEITGFQRKLSLHNIKRNIVTLWNLALSGPKAKAMMKEVKPDLVIGCGGYVSGPVVRCAAKMGIHTAIHEQNALQTIKGLIEHFADFLGQCRVGSTLPAAGNTVFLSHSRNWFHRLCRKCVCLYRTACQQGKSHHSRHANRNRLFHNNISPLLIVCRCRGVHPVLSLHSGYE